MLLSAAPDGQPCSLLGVDMHSDGNGQKSLHAMYSGCGGKPFQVGSQTHRRTGAQTPQRRPCLLRKQSMHAFNSMPSVEQHARTMAGLCPSNSAALPPAPRHKPPATTFLRTTLRAVCTRTLPRGTRSVSWYPSLTPVPPVCSQNSGHTHTHTTLKHPVQDAEASCDASFANVAMAGQDVFKFAVRSVPSVIEAALKQAGLEKEQVDWLVMHQANQRILDAAATRLGLPAERVREEMGHGMHACAGPGSRHGERVCSCTNPRNSAQEQSQGREKSKAVCSGVCALVEGVLITGAHH